MNRRDFLKNSIGALLFGALTSNKVLASVIESVPKDSLDVLLYLIQNKEGEWKIKGTIWTNLAKERLDPYKFNLDTFKPLKIVDNLDANKVKKFYWAEYNCSGKCVSLNYLQSYKNGVKAKESGQFIEFVKIGGKSKSDRKIKHLKSLTEKYGKSIGKKNTESGLLKSICSSGGKVGGKVQFKKGLGIHNPDKVLEYKRLGGLAQVKNLNLDKTCPHCGVLSRGAGYNRWHGDKCKQK
jgi:hypothetical protein